MAPSEPTLSIPGLDRAYHWQEAWGGLPAPSDAGAWAHPGLAVDAGGDVYVVDADRPEVHVLDRGGALRRTIRLPVTEAHGLLLDLSGAEPTIWVAESGLQVACPRVPSGARRDLRRDAW